MPFETGKSGADLEFPPRDQPNLRDLDSDVRVRLLYLCNFKLQRFLLLCTLFVTKLPSRMIGPHLVFRLSSDVSNMLTGFHHTN